MKKILCFCFVIFLLSMSFSAAAQKGAHPRGLFTLTQPTTTTMNVTVVLSNAPAIPGLKLVHAPNGLLGTVPGSNMSKTTGPNFASYSQTGITLNSDVNHGFLKIRHSTVEDSLWFNIHYAAFYNPTPGAELKHRDQQVTFATGATESFTNIIVSSADFPVHLSHGLPYGWEPASDIINITARKSSGAVTTFTQAATLKVNYTDAFFTQAEEGNMALFRWDQTTNDWVREKCVQPDTVNNNVSTTINRAGTYVLCVLVDNLVLAPIFNVSNRSYAAAKEIYFSGAIDSLAKIKLITGKEIVFSDGFFAGGTAELNIVTTNGYCGAVMPASAMDEINEVYSFLEDFPLEEDSIGYDQEPLNNLMALSFREDTSVETTEQAIQVIPNPFSDDIKVIYELPEAQSVSIKIYEVGGKEVTQLYNSNYADAGPYAHNFRTSLLKPGLYFLVIQTAKQAPRVAKIIKQ